jgi:hypothetical protein
MTGPVIPNENISPSSAIISIAGNGQYERYLYIFSLNINLLFSSISSTIFAMLTSKIFLYENDMSPHFLCYSCSRTTPCQQDDKVCPVCSSTEGRILSDEEHKRQHEEGTIKLIDPRTGKAFKKK